MEITGVDVEITAGSDVSGCAPFDVQFNSQLVNAADILWDFGDGTTSALAAPSHTYSTPGTYTVMLIGIDTILCTGGLFADTAYATITVNAIATPADANVDRTVCGNVAAQLGTPPVVGYTYAWSPSTGLSNASVAQPNASPSTPQTYTLTVTDANGCNSVICTNISLNSGITIATNVLSGNLNCANSATGVAEVTVSGGTQPYSYQWDNGQTNATVSGLTGGIHCVTVSDVNQCIQTACVTITGPAALNIAVVSTGNVSCFGVADGTFTVTSLGGTAPYI
jgi:PKD repeat protein